MAQSGRSQLSAPFMARWGRNIETPGEDPYVSGEYATSFVRGFQESSADKQHILASACCKQ